MERTDWLGLLVLIVVAAFFVGVGVWDMKRNRRLC